MSLLSRLTVMRLCGCRTKAAGNRLSVQLSLCQTKVPGASGSSGFLETPVLCSKGSWLGRDEERSEGLSRDALKGRCFDAGQPVILQAALPRQGPATARPAMLRSRAPNDVEIRRPRCGPSAEWSCPSGDVEGAATTTHPYRPEVDFVRHFHQGSRSFGLGRLRDLYIG